jgi:hypothetical protein
LPLVRNNENRAAITEHTNKKNKDPKNDLEEEKESEEVQIILGV